VRNADLTEDRSGRDLGPGEQWRPLAGYLVARFAAPGAGDEKMMQVALAVIRDAEDRLGSPRPDLSVLVVPLVIRALRRHRCRLIRCRPASGRPVAPRQLAVAAAEIELTRRLRRSPTIAEVATHLDMAQHQIVAELEAGWSAGPRVPAPR
jgi:RNA polymerase sigma-B factor